MVRRMASPTRKTGKEDKGRLQIIYFGAAFHYYIAARYAMVARFGPISGNLVHHAIEFFLKGALIDKLDEAARRKFHHNLQKLWKKYKNQRNDPALAKFDQTISDINKFERIRYPEEMLRLGMLAEIGPVRNTFPQPRGTKRPRAARYQLAFDEVDELVELIFQIERLNPEFFTRSLDEDAKRYLEHQNNFSLRKR
jgi:hypothetical protein